MITPKISIILPTYRRENGLLTALDSLAKQTYRNFEIILIDDNGMMEWNQKTQEAVDSFLSQNPDTVINVIFNSENKGSARTRNIGIATATGEYITFLDDDDVYLPNKLSNQVLEMIKAEADFSLTDLELYNEHDRLVERRVRSYIRQTDPSSLLSYHLMYHMTGTDTLMFRKAYLQSIGGFDPVDVGDEFFLIQKAIIGGGKFCYVPVCDVKAYVHTGALGGLSSGQQKIDGENRLHERKKEFFQQIDAKERRYICMRHYAVLAFAGMRMKAPLYTLKNGILSFACAPLSCVKLLLERKI